MIIFYARCIRAEWSFIMSNKPYPYYDVPNVKTLKELIKLCEDKYADRRVFWYADNKGNTTEVKYSQYVQSVNRLGAYLMSKKAKGTHIALYGENSCSWVVAYFAVVCGGNVIVPVDKELSPAEASDIIKRSNSEILFYSDNYSSEVEEMDIEGVEKINLKDIDKLGDDSLLADFAKVEVTPDDLASIVYTSGTTGKPKGVMLTHGNFASDTVNASANLFIQNGTVLLLPLHHTFGLVAGITCMFLRGYSVFINQSLRFLVRDLQIAKPKHMSVVPLIIETLYKRIWETAEKENKAGLLRILIKISNALLKVGIDLRKQLFASVRKAFGGELEILISGGAAIAPEVINGIAAFGIKTVNGYGITECSPIVSTTRNKHNNFPSVGSVIRDCEVKIVNPDSDGNGEIYVRGSIVTKGYYMDEKANAESFEDGWFKTGDIGCFDKEGFLCITGRKKNLIILSNGKNISPEELEFLVQKIDNVLEVVVYAEDGLITAEIFAEDRTGIEEAVLSELNKTLPTFKQIQKVKFRDVEFEKTSTKKIKR